MQIVKYKKSKGNTYEIEFDNNETITLFDDIIIKHELLIKHQINEDERRKIIVENDKLDSYYKAIKYISVKLRSEKELIAYLKKFPYSQEMIEETIIKLKKEGYIDEKKYINSYLNDAIRFSNDGPNKIAQKLKDLGIDENLIETTIQNQPEELWQEKLEKLLEKKIKNNHTDSEEKWKNKCIEYCYLLGYKKASIKNTINEMEIPENPQIIEKEYEKIKRKCERKYQGKELSFQIKMKLQAKGFKKEQIEKYFE